MQKSSCLKKKYRQTFLYAIFCVWYFYESHPEALQEKPHRSLNFSLKIKISCVLSRCSGPSNQACVGPDRPTSSSLVSLYPALGYRAIMQEMSPTAFGEEVKSRLPICLAVLPDSVWKNPGLRNAMLITALARSPSSCVSHSLNLWCDPCDSVWSCVNCTQHSCRKQHVLSLCAHPSNCWHQLKELKNVKQGGNVFDNYNSCNGYTSVWKDGHTYLFFIIAVMHIWLGLVSSSILFRLRPNCLDTIKYRKMSCHSVPNFDT